MNMIYNDDDDTIADCDLGQKFADSIGQQEEDIDEYDM